MKPTPHFTPSATLLRAVRRSVVVGLLVLGFQSASGGIKSERLLATILKQTPEATLVPEGQQMKVAEMAAADMPGAQTFWGVGGSMEPLFAPKTAIIVQQVAFSDLKKGMTVVYVDRRGCMIAHALTGDLPNGWVAQGINNDMEDPDLVTPANLVGVIVQAFSAMHTDYRVELTKLLVAKGKLNVMANRS
jgi:hypothetical protein